MRCGKCLSPTQQECSLIARCFVEEVEHLFLFRREVPPIMPLVLGRFFEYTVFFYADVSSRLQLSNSLFYRVLLFNNQTRVRV